MRIVQTRAPSLPQVDTESPLRSPPSRVWHVLCGDTGKWRAGTYSPACTSSDQIDELERHDCPELFLLLRGRLTLLVAQGKATREITLEPGVPVLVAAPHTGFCPDGPHTGVAFVVERDSFETEYGTVEEWTRDG